MMPTRPTKTEAPDMLKPAEVAARLRIHVRTLAKWIAVGRFTVKSVHFSAKTVLYPRVDVEAWIAEHLARRG